MGGRLPHRRLLHTRQPPVPTAATAWVPLADVSPPVVVIDPPEWVPDEACGFCTACKAPFTVIRRKHHCRSCGKVGGVAEVVPRPLGLSLRASQGPSQTWR